MRFSPLVANLRRSAGEFPDRPAIVDGEERIDFRSLWARTLAWSAHLRAEGIEAGDRVAIVLENSVDYVVAFYGALAAGAIAVPLNTTGKARDFSAWLQHSGATWLVCAPGNDEVANAWRALGDPPRVVLAGRHPAESDAAWARIGGLVVPDPGCGSVVGEPSADLPACLLYTSGTTGAPKAVLLSHGNLASNTAAIVDYLDLGPHDCSVCILPFFYAYGSSVLHSHLKAGASLVLAPNFVYPHLVVERIVQHRATGFAGVPSTFSLLLDRVDLGRYDLSSLRYLTQAGGPMSPALAARLREALPDASLFIMYGQTEAAARLTYLPPADLERKPGSVGIALRDVQIEVRGESGERARPREPGDVWVRGPNVMLGYWRSPEATKAVLKDGWLKTGDIGYLDEDGYLYLGGRRSDMIKVGAQRVHPGDIEEVLQELAGVAEAAAVGVDDAVLGQAVKAFIVPAAGAVLDAMTVKAHCRERLAAHKIPKYVEIITTLPRTASGKIRRHELLNPGVS